MIATVLGHSRAGLLFALTLPVAQGACPAAPPSASDAGKGRDAEVSDSGTPGRDSGAPDAGTEARWIGPLDPGGGGQIQDIEIHPVDGDVVYALINSGGLARSRDGGATWAVLNRGLDYASSGYLAAGGMFLGMHPTRPEVLLRSSQDATIYLSTDGGDDWSHSYSNPDIVDEYTDFIYDPEDPNLVYVAVGGNNAILVQDYAERSVRNNLVLRGRYDPESAVYDWHVVMDDLGDLEELPIYSLDVRRDGPSSMLYLTSAAGLNRGLIEADAITELESLNLAPGLPTAEALSAANVVVDDRVPGRVYLAVGNAAGSEGGVYRSENGGETFEILTDRAGYDPFGTGDFNNRFFVFATSPFAPEVLYASMVKFEEARRRAGGTLLRSTDDGLTWQPMVQLENMLLGWKDYTERPHRFAITNVAPSPVREDVVYVSTPSGSHLFRTDDATAESPHWTVMSTRLVDAGPPARWTAGFPAIAFQWSIAIHPSDPDTLVVPYGDHGIFVSHDRGRSFVLQMEDRDLGETYGGTLVIDERDPSLWYLAEQGSHMNLDDGAVLLIEGSGTRSRYLGGEPGAERGFPRAAACSLLVEYGADEHRTLYVTNYARRGGGGVYRSMDGGDFEQIFVLDRARAMAPAGDFETLYVGADGAGLFQLSRSGDEWSGRQICSSGEALCPSTFYAMRKRGSSLGVLIGADIGVVAVEPTGELSMLWEGRDVWDVAVNPHDDAILYAVTDHGGGVLRSASGGADWENVTGDLPTLNTMRLAVDPLAPDTVFVGTKSAGIWMRE